MTRPVNLLGVSMFWILVFSYWVHLLATVVWFGGLAVLAMSALPALRKGTIDENSWLVLQRKLLPWANLSLMLLLITITTIISIICLEGLRDVIRHCWCWRSHS